MWRTTYVSPMLLLGVESLPQGAAWRARLAWAYCFKETPPPCFPLEFWMINPALERRRLRLAFGG
jgi:hypothetical protein